MNYKRSLIYIIFAAMMSFVTINTAFVQDASAKPKQESEYDKLIKQGVKAYESQDYDGALGAFNSAYALKQESSILYNIGRICEDKADYNCAIEHYRKFLLAPGSDPDAREDAKDRIKSCTETLELAGGVVSAPATAPSKAPAAAAAAPAPGGCINVNTASSAELQSINGIGAAIANNIIEYRANKPFKSVNDLLEVKKIGPKTFENIKPYICPIGGGAVNTQPAPAPAAAAPKAAAPKADPKKADTAPKAKKDTKLSPAKTGDNFDI